MHVWMWKLKFYWSLVLACRSFICVYLRGLSLMCIVWKQWWDSKSVKVSKITMCAKQLRGELVELLAAESVLDFFCGESTIHFQAVCTKGRLLAAGLVCPLTVSWLRPPDSHRSIMVHPSGRGHPRQLSPSLQIKSVSYPSWASCL